MNKNKLVICIIIMLCVIVCISLFFLKINKDNVSVNENNSNINVEIVSEYNNPIIPMGFKKIETNEASWELDNNIPKGWNKGLVIEDDLGNQFVWVPLNIKSEQFGERDIKYSYSYNKNEMDVKEKEDLQILKFGGFYVARYEAGIPTEIANTIKEFDKKTNNVEGIPTSKKDRIVWNYIDWDMAKKNSMKMYQNESIESNLITTKQWNNIMQWILKSNFNIENSVEWGNYSNNNFTFSGYYSIDYGKTYKNGENTIKQTYNMILSTGATDRNKSNNIYDLAGNVSEFADVHKWNNGKYGAEESYRNWGGCYDNISHYSANSSMSISDENSRQGFRVVLYLK